ncbi:MAG: MFS transporter [Roseiflexaceae bacterium]
MVARITAGIRSYSPAALLYLVAAFMIGFALDGGVFSVLFNLYLARIGYDTELIGLVNGIAQLTFAVSSFPVGMLGARFGVRRMLVAGLILMIVGMLALPMADLLPDVIRVGWLIAGEVVLYIGLALYFVNSSPFLVAVVKPEQRSQVFGIQSTVFAFSAFAGGLVGGFLPGLFARLLASDLSSPIPYRYPLLIAGFGLLLSLGAIIAARDGDESVADAAATSEQDQGGHPSLVLPSAILVVIAMMGLVRMFQVSGLAATSSFFNLYLDQQLQIPTDQIGTIAAFSRLLAAPVGLMTPWLARRLGGFGVVFGSTLVTGIAILPIAFIPHWSAAGASLFAVVALSSIRYASSMVYFFELVPIKQRATVSGMTEMSAGISFTLIAFAGGYIIKYVSYQALFLFGAALSIIGALVFWFYFRQFERKQAS